jgi:hypothetical protein
MATLFGTFVRICLGTSELSSWVDFCYQMRKRGVIVVAYANNHYAGHAPATIKQFQ